MAPEREGKNWYLVEALGFAALVGMYIWKWQEASPQTWWVLAAWLVVSAVLRHDTPKTLGWRADNLWAATRRAIPFFTIASLVVCGAGLISPPSQCLRRVVAQDRKSTRLNSSHQIISYAVFCLKKK